VRCLLCAWQRLKLHPKGQLSMKYLCADASPAEAAVAAATSAAAATPAATTPATAT